MKKALKQKAFFITVKGFSLKKIKQNFLEEFDFKKQTKNLSKLSKSLYQNKEPLLQYFTLDKFLIFLQVNQQKRVGMVSSNKV